MFPEQVTRVTKHKKPKRQVYQPGFNPANSYWLSGEWITIPEEGWEARFAAHEALYGDLRAKTYGQHHRDPETPVSALNQAQKQAYEFYCGDMRFHVRYENGYVGGFSARMSGTRLHERSTAWLRQNKAQILRYVIQNKKVVNQVEGLDLPDDVVLMNTEAEAADPWDAIVEQNRQRDSEMFDAMVQMAGQSGMTINGDDFTTAMAFHALVKDEESIVWAEYHEHRSGQPMSHHNHPKVVAEYVRKRKALVEKFGDAFTGHYEQARASHNSCARTNLDNSNGFLACYVLPRFNEDGTHEPWGERDVPWGRDDF